MRKNITIKMLLLLSFFVSSSTWALWKETTFYINPELFVTGSIWAKFKTVGETKDATLYIDPATITKEGNLRRVLVIANLKDRKAYGDKPAQTREEYDCKNERYKINFRLQPIGSPSRYFSGWQVVPAGTVSADILKIVCAL